MISKDAGDCPTSSCQRAEEWIVKGEECSELKNPEYFSKAVPECGGGGRGVAWGGNEPKPNVDGLRGTAKLKEDVTETGANEVRRRRLWRRAADRSCP